MPTLSLIGVQPLAIIANMSERNVFGPVHCPFWFHLSQRAWTLTTVIWKNERESASVVICYDTMTAIV